jgi:hypothetical protein
LCLLLGERLSELEALYKNPPDALPSLVLREELEVASLPMLDMSNPSAPGRCIQTDTWCVFLRHGTVLHSLYCTAVQSEIIQISVWGGPL